MSGFVEFGGLLEHRDNSHADVRVDYDEDNTVAVCTLDGEMIAIRDISNGPGPWLNIWPGLFVTDLPSRNGVHIHKDHAEIN